MTQFISFSSGSAGNCYLLRSGVREEDRKGILIDTGISLRALKKGLETHAMNYESFSAILVTHDHLDHIRHLGSFCKKLHKPVYAAPMLHDALSHHTMAAPHISGCRKDLEGGVWNDVDGFKVRWFTVPHDASHTVGYAIMAPDGHKFVLMTDMGRMTGEAMSMACQADTVVIESNYDTEMLRNGPYTPELKMRIAGGNGHLSNAECAEAISEFMHDGLKNVFLCHLSENNNTPALALKSAGAVLKGSGVRLIALPRTHPSVLFDL